MLEVKATSPEPELHVRFVAGFGKNPVTGENEHFIVRLFEDAEGNRYGTNFVAQMDDAQLAHLYMQLGNSMKIAGIEPETESARE